MRPGTTGGTERGSRRKRGSSAFDLGVFARISCALLAATVVAGLTGQLNSPASAQEAPSLLRLPDSKKGAPMLVQADEMTYDTDADTVTASGNVEIYYADYVLTARRVVYDKRNNTVAADGDVRLKEPDGNVVFADSLTLTGDFREGFVRSLSLLTPENARVAASSARRHEGNVIIFDKAVYSACQVDPKHPERAPFWQIKAVKVVHNQAEQTIEYTDAQFELMGVPIAYLPRFSHADPSVKRKSGFLAPKFEVSNQLGFGVETPYFWALAPNYDITFSPRTYTKQGVLMQAEWRHRLVNGSYIIRPAGIYQLDSNDLVSPGNTEWRGSLETAGEFRLNQNWRTGWDVLLSSDDTFLRVYDLSSKTDVVSQGYLIGQSDRNYFDMRVMHLKGLQTTDDNDTQPLVHPVVDYNYLFADPIFGGELGFDANVLSLSRQDGVDTSRVVTDVHWRRTFTDAVGQRITPFFDFRGDIYQVNDLVDPISLTPKGSETVLRGQASVGLEYSYPFISAHSWGSQVIEPVAQLIARPNETDRRDLANEDAQSLVFDDTLLFDRDKFSGFDRVEGGTRANVGMRYTLQTNDWGYGTVLLGQSFHLAGDNPFGTNTGLGSDRSDFVGSLYLEPNNTFGVATRFRLDKDSLAIRRHEINGWMRYGRLFGSITYAKLSQDPLLGNSNREEILTNASVKLADKWRAFGLLRYDLDGHQKVQNGIGLGYFCDCANIRIDYVEDFFRDRDDKPDRRVTLRVELKTLGDFGVSSGGLSSSGF